MARYLMVSWEERPLAPSVQVTESHRTLLFCMLRGRYSTVQFSEEYVHYVSIPKSSAFGDEDYHFLQCWRLSLDATQLAGTVDFGLNRPHCESP